MLYEPPKFWFNESNNTQPLLALPFISLYSPGSSSHKSSPRIFQWCGCSEEFTKAESPSESKFLNLLMSDLEIKDNCLVLPKPIKEYIQFEDDYVARSRAHLDIPMSDRSSIYDFTLQLGLTGVYAYLLMNYLENIGYMGHGCAIRCGYKN